jgi:hypothetical protein
MTVCPLPPVSVNKRLVFSGLRSALHGSYLILLEFAPDISKQWGYGWVCWLRSAFNFRRAGSVRTAWVVKDTMN